MKRVVVVDDEALVRSGFTALLSSHGAIEVAGSAADGQEAIRVVRRERPDVVLMDLRMPVLDGVSATRSIVADPALRATRILVLTTFDTDDLVHEALYAGASGFLVKDTEPSQLLDAVLRVADGEVVLSPDVLNRVIDRHVREQKPAQHAVEPSWLATLTPREHEVLLEVADGASNAEIGVRLHMSPATAKTHVARLLMKAAARDRVALVVAAHRAGLAGRGSGD